MAGEPAEYPALMWRKSRASEATGSCVEVAFQGSAVLMRDSRAEAGVILEVSSGSWRAFIARIRAGDLAIRTAIIP